MIKNLICIECPMGCSLTAETEGETVSVTGNSCPRGKAYAVNEMTCPKRVVTSTVRTREGRLVPVRTERPVRKSELFAVMQKINALHPAEPVRPGDVLLENVDEDVSLIATGSPTE